MTEYILLILGAASLGVGAVLGYFTRQSVAKFQAGSIERTIQEKLSEAKTEAQNIILDAKKKAFSLSEQTRKKIEDRERELMVLERQLERRQGILDQKIADFEEKEKNLLREKRELARLRGEIDKIISQKKQELERISGISKEEAKKEIFAETQKEYQKEFEQKLSRLEKEGEEKIQQRAKEVLSFAVQRLPSSSITELTTTIVSLPDDEIKGRIIGKEGRNIKAFEEATGVELMVDETPNVVFLSSFDPLRREIAKIALERLIKDGRIQPSRIEEIVKDVQEKIPEKIQKIGKEAAYKVEVFDLDPKLHQLLGRLKFRTSFGQNVLDHSIEVSILAKSLAEEIGADSKIAAKAGLLHDIGKAVDWQVEGSHIDIGIRILEKFKVENEVIKAMKSHHEDYPYESIEAVLVQTADAISASRPGARKDNTENYLKRLEELENIAKRFPGVKNAYALEAGREIRVFVKNDEVDDFESKKLAQEIAKNIEEELNYPGEVKVVVIRETRVTEYAR
ncbi:MAG TPA: ribonuclease Y [Candidatus Pacearchaeota archaeon]|nr:ribonuclease Y [Candidatus Pacearchaeota archaeon]HPZ74680.1 ribonuclease Y [Candidatus Pacearchaeota archaeon]HQD89213.1 ribonuclease Y [Candidatus Pacearchaeota archaeon]